MAVKTITIDMDAYDILSRLKRKGQSFSEVIKERLGSRATGRDLLAVIRNAGLAKDTLASIDRQIRGRRRSPARTPRL